MMTYLIVGLVSLAALLVVYYGVKRFFPTWGTVAMNAFGFVGMAAEFAGELPWSSVLDSKTAAMIGFAITTANVIARRGAKAPIMGGK